jgi:hypothetical protein
MKINHIFKTAKQVLLSHGEMAVVVLLTAVPSRSFWLERVRFS